MGKWAADTEERVKKIRLRLTCPNETYSVDNTIAKVRQLHEEVTPSVATLAP